MEEKKSKVIFTVMAVLLIAVFCFSLVPKTLQNDTYYTIKIGEYIIKNGITMEDPFSWHEGLKYTFPHWAYDVATYLVYNLGGFDRNIHSDNYIKYNIRFDNVFYKC